VFDFVPKWLIGDDFTFYTLLFLVFVVGFGIGGDTSAFVVLKRIKIKVLLVPILVVVGSLSGTALFSLFLHHITVGQAMAVGSGFGYYSLSSVIISRLSGEELGVIALLANVFREITTLIAAPLMVKYFGKLAIIASGGATAMDTTLPVIVRFTGKEYGVIAVFSGIVLTILVPFLVPFILEIFQ
jgi:uncharacterized membrane protein YbjE (DUF340 family)